MNGTGVTDTIRPAPYWWDRTPPEPAAAVDLPGRADVVVVGSGYTGLSAGLRLARAGREVVVLEAETAGWGCSSRNGGQISTSIKPEEDDLARRHGADVARDVVAEGRAALAWIGDFVREEGIDCDFRVPGRFHAAHSRAAYERLARSIDDRAGEAWAVPRADQHREIGTDAYCGGVVYSSHASVDPARLHRGLLDRARAAGVILVTGCRASRLARAGRGTTVSTSRGDIEAGAVIVATNGYTDGLVPWLRRRVIPIGSYMIATEPLGPGVLDRLLPTDRVISDTRDVVYYYRTSPDRTRILFGGRVTTGEASPLRAGTLLRRDLVRLFPELSGVGISHSWMGFVAYTFDRLAHVGEHDGVHYAMGYCGSGVSMACYLGTRLGQQVLGRPEGRTGFDRVPFSTRPLYTGRPWFLPAAVAWYRWRDRIGTGR